MPGWYLFWSFKLGFTTRSWRFLASNNIRIPANLVIQTYRSEPSKKLNFSRSRLEGAVPPVDCRTSLVLQLRQALNIWAAAIGGVTNGGLRGAWPPFLEIGRILPFSPFSGGCEEHWENPATGGKRPFSLRYPQICLKPHLLSPHLRHSKILLLSKLFGVILLAVFRKAAGIYYINRASHWLWLETKKASQWANCARFPCKMTGMPHGTCFTHLPRPPPS